MRAPGSKRWVHHCRPALESLEDRTLLNGVSLVGGNGLDPPQGNPAGTSTDGIFVVAISPQTPQRRFLTNASLVLQTVSSMAVGNTAAHLVVTIPGAPASGIGSNIGTQGRLVMPVGPRGTEVATIEGAEPTFFVVGVGGQPDEGWGAISGRVVAKLRPDGTPEPGEPGLAGQSVVLAVEANGMFVPRQRATTNTNGEYSFTGLGPGRYRVELLECSNGPDLCRHDLTLKEGAKVQGMNFGKVPPDAAAPLPQSPLGETISGPMVNDPSDDGSDIPPSDADMALLDWVFQGWEPADAVVPYAGPDASHPESSPAQLLLAAALVIGTTWEFEHEKRRQTEAG